uniref:Uncharacterized protein n=1 Tax=Anguilla anguilla TaxID=7936 RepID=A0A0E9WGJ9_ANGAN
MLLHAMSQQDFMIAAGRRALVSAWIFMGLFCKCLPCHPGTFRPCRLA